MTLGYIVREKYADPTISGIPALAGKGVRANRNIIAIIDVVDDATPQTIVHTYYTQGNDLSDAFIDDFARGLVATVATQLATIGAITVGEFKIPAPVDQSVLDLQTAQADFRQKLQDAQIAALNNPDVSAAYAAVKTAQTAATKSGAATSGVLTT